LLLLLLLLLLLVWLPRSSVVMLTLLLLMLLMLLSGKGGSPRRMRINALIKVGVMAGTRRAGFLDGWARFAITITITCGGC